MDLISREELKEKLDRGDDFTLIMVMGEWAFRAQHIPGSININSPEEAVDMDRDAEIVVYCTGGPCIASLSAYNFMKGMGFRHLRRYAGGLEDWVNANYPTEGEMVENSG